MPHALRWWRWFVVAAVVAGLVALPSIVRAWPVNAPDVAPGALAARIAASADQPYSGNVEARGRLDLPAVGDDDDFDELAGLLGGSSRLRIWYVSATAWRVDVISPVGERDLYRDATGMWDWHSGRRRARRTSVAPGWRLPGPADLAPPELGRRLVAAAQPTEIGSLDPARVAGRSSPGLRIRPASPATTIDHVDVWADAATGLPFRVVVVPKARRHPVLESQFLDVSLARPSDARVTFTPAAGMRVRHADPDDPDDPVAAVAQFSIVPLPAELAGLARRSDRSTGVATYGTGFTVVAVAGLPSRILDRVIPASSRPSVRPWGGEARVFATPLVNVMAISVNGTGYVLAGPVSVDELDRVAAVDRPPMTPIVSTVGLTKRYGRLTVVDGVDLDVHEGDLFGFLGPNGSGKTTTIRMLLGLVYPTAGSIEVLGHPVPARATSVLADVGALVEGPGFYPGISGRRNLALFDAAGPGAGGGRQARRRRVDDAIEQVGLGGIDRRHVRAYSTGMRQRLALAAALIRRPRLLVLDEPTNGLDPQGMRELRSLFVALADGGVTVLLSSHLLGEVEMICTRAAMMASGRVVAQDRVDRLLAPTGRVVIDTPDLETALTVLARAAGNGTGPRVEQAGQRMAVNLNGWAPERLNRELVDAGVRVREFVIERRTLEDTYLGLTGRSGDVAR